MATVDLGPLLRRAMKEQMEEFKEELRVLQEKAWDAGARAAEEDPYGCKNPFSKET